MKLKRPKFIDDYSIDRSVCNFVRSSVEDSIHNSVMSSVEDSIWISGLILVMSSVEDFCLRFPVRDFDKNYK